MNRRKNLEVDEAEYQRVLRLIVGKAQRYSLAKVEISDRLVATFSPDQVERLIEEVAEAGHELVFKNQTRMETRSIPRFGSDPHSPKGGRHPKAVDWANSGLRGSRS